MPNKYPKRVQNHNLEELSNRFYDSCLPDNWYAYSPKNDYGVDLITDIFEGENATGLELLIQLKSTENRSEGDIERQTLRIATFNYLRDKLQVVMIVKYVHAENEAYYILLKDIPEPNQENETFTVSIPKENTLSTIDWDSIKEYVKGVTERKLAAQKAYFQAERRENDTQQSV